jgi:hypothetical protein
MSLKELQEEASALDAGSRRRLMAFLVALEDRGDEAYRRELSSRIEDKSPENWISLDKARTRLAEDE